MKRLFKVHKSAKTIRLTKDLVGDGFKGELQGYANSCTLVLLRPGTSLETAVEALEAIIQDLRLREKLDSQA